MPVRLLTISNARIVTPERIFEGSILVRNGVIEKIQRGKASSQTDTVYDASGRYVLPGMIETHGHLREPARNEGFEKKGDVPHETRAALAGGVTTVFDMPNSVPPTTTVDRLHEKIEIFYPGRSYTDYGFWMGAASDSLGELKLVDPAEIVGDKIFMAGHETTPTTIPDDETLGRAFKILADRNILAAVHAEDQELIGELEREYRKSGRTDAALYSEIRPTEVVSIAVGRAIKLAKKHGNRLYLLHLSTPEELAQVDAAKREGLEVYGELFAHQLEFSIEDYVRLGNRIKVAPALRSREVQDEMWRRFREGLIDTICAEHAPHYWPDKERDNMWEVPAGIPGLQEVLPGLITAFVSRFGRRHVEECLMLLSRYWAANIAEIFGLKTKGSIEEGRDADFSIIDLDSTWTVAKGDLFAKCGGSAYEGMDLIGRPHATFLRGNLVYENGKIMGDPLGQWVKNR